MAQGHLGKSGLAIEDFLPGDVVPVTPAMAVAVGQFEFPGYLLWFRGPDGKLTGFVRQRNLSGKGGKELQIAGPGAQIYFPVIDGIDWLNLEPGSVVYICESVIKAVRTVKAGVVAIGINGCSAFRSKKTGQCNILDDLKRIDWKGRNLTARILFDSNVRDNPRVKIACTTLAYELSALGAKVDVIKLPHKTNSRQQGIDDYLQAGGKFEDLVAEGIPYIKELGALNEEYAYLGYPAGVLNLKTGMLHTVRNGVMARSPIGRCGKKYLTIDLIRRRPSRLKSRSGKNGSSGRTGARTRNGSLRRASLKTFRTVI
jgi:Domain of unknown function (DUF3854)